MEKDFKLIKLCFLQGPCLCSPEEKVHWDGLEVEVFVVDVEVRVMPYFLQCAHRSGG